MKKIISIVCVLAMMLSFAVTANAANKEVTFELVEQDETKAVYNINIETDDTISTITTYFDGAAATEKGATVTVTPVKGTSCKFQRNTIMANFIPSDGSTLTGKQTIATVTFTNVSEAFNIAAVDATGKRFKVTIKDPNGGADIDATASYSHATNVTVAPFSAGPVEEEVTSAVVECAKTWTAPKSAENSNTNTYTNVAVANGTCVAGAKEAGFKFIKNDANAAPSFSVTVLDAAATAGEGTIDYTAVMYGVKYDEDRIDAIYAIPYYVIER